MIMEPEIQPATELVPLNTIRVETALSRYPVHRLARKGSIDISIREGTRDGGETTVGGRLQQEARPARPAGLQARHAHHQPPDRGSPPPHSASPQARQPERHLPRTRTWPTAARTAATSRTSLFQNAFAGITAKTRYRQGDGTERTLEAAFTRYSVILTGEKLPDGRKADAVYIILNDVFIQVINGAMTRPLDYDYLKSLPPAPQRFYELLSYQMYAALQIRPAACQADLFRFLCPCPADPPFRLGAGAKPDEQDAPPAPAVRLYRQGRL